MDRRHKSKSAKRERRNSSVRRRSRAKPGSAHRSTNAEQLRRLQAWLFPEDRIFARLKLHGNTTWLSRSLVWLALCWAWSDAATLTEAFTQTVGSCKLLAGDAALSTYQGFMGAAVRWTDSLLRLLWPVLHQRLQEIGGEFWQIGGWVPIAFDGSRSTAPRSQANESALCAPHYGHGQTAKYRKKKTKGLRRAKNKKHKPQPQEPQAWITLMWHMGLRLPWMWRLGPSHSSERAHVMEMLDTGEFPKNTLFCGDAGFVGYPLWAHLAEAGQHFLVRVGANVSLLTQSPDCTLQKNGRVLCWPQAARRLKRPPLHLRLVQVRIGRTWMWMLTNVLSPSQLTLAQIVRCYQQRWGIEVEFRGLKQTLDRAKLRCRNDRRLLVELNWSIMAMTIAELFALKEQLATSVTTCVPLDRKIPKPDPQRRSLANTMRALRFCLRHLKEFPTRGHDLPSRLRLAVTDAYVRKGSKRARYHPPNPDKKPLGDPKLSQLSPQEKKQLTNFTNENIAA